MKKPRKNNRAQERKLLRVTVVLNTCQTAAGLVGLLFHPTSIIWILIAAVSIILLIRNMNRLAAIPTEEEDEEDSQWKQW